MTPAAMGPRFDSFWCGVQGMVAALEKVGPRVMAGNNGSSKAASGNIRLTREGGRKKGVGLKIWEGRREDIRHHVGEEQCIEGGR